MIIPNVDTKLNLDNISNVEELSGELSKSDEQKLMSSLIEGDKESLDESKLINESINLFITFRIEKIIVLLLLKIMI